MSSALEAILGDEIARVEARSREAGDCGDDSSPAQDAPVVLSLDAAPLDGDDGGAIDNDRATLATGGGAADEDAAAAEQPPSEAAEQSGGDEDAAAAPEEEEEEEGADEARQVKSILKAPSVSHSWTASLATMYAPPSRDGRGEEKETARAAGKPRGIRFSEAVEEKVITGISFVEEEEEEEGEEGEESSEGGVSPAGAAESGGAEEKDDFDDVWDVVQSAPAPAAADKEDLAAEWDAVSQQRDAEAEDGEAEAEAEAEPRARTGHLVVLETSDEDESSSSAEEEESSAELEVFGEAAVERPAVPVAAVPVAQVERPAVPQPVVEAEEAPVEEAAAEPDDVPLIPRRASKVPTAFASDSGDSGSSDEEYSSSLLEEAEQWDRINEQRRLEAEAGRVVQVGTGDDAAAAAADRENPLANPIVTYREAVAELLAMDLSRVKAALPPFESGGGGGWRRFFFCGPPRLRADLEDERDTMFALALLKFDDESALHQRLIYTVYMKLTGSSRVPPRRGEHWDEVGFQGVDPATDLRGGGILALVHMVYFIKEARDVMQQIYRLSLDERQEFPFCVVSINITCMALTAMRDGHLARECNRRGSVLGFVAHFYAALFWRFYSMWQRGQLTIVDFAATQERLEADCRRHPETILREFSDMLQSRVNVPRSDAPGF